MKRPANWKQAAPAPLAGTPTFAAQHALPRLPVPALDATLQKWKESLAPLAWSDAEHAAAVRKVEAFGAAGGAGRELHARLVRHAQGREHWLEEWWDDGGYLGYRDSVVVNVSYYYGFDAHPAHLPQTAVHRAASITRATMLFRQQLKLGQVKPEGSKDAPFCMDTFRWMFDCCRVPGPEGLDWSTSYAKAGDRGDTGHVIVLRNGRFWRLDAAQNGRILSTAELEQQIQHIVDSTPDLYPGVGILTASNRDVWAKDYAALAADPHNASILEAIHSAAFVLCLDTERPSDLIEHSRFLWHGASGPGRLGLHNRWVDKPVQMIVFDNAKAGIMGEHSVMDGTPTVTLCDTVLDMIADPAFDHGAPVAGGAAVAGPAALDWVVGAETEAAMRRAEADARALIGGQAMAIHRTAYGKRAIKAFGVSPDSWAQMVVQLAYARLLRATGARRAGGTYEAATTRRFLKGRTEAIRVVSAESDEWVRAMDDVAYDVEARKRKLRDACKKHGEVARAAGKAEGVDRHLFGLKKVLKEGEAVPEVFQDPLVQRSSYWALSTSAIFSKHFGPYGWGEVVPDGFGVAYMTGFDDCLQYTVTSRTEMPNAEFVQEIARAATEMYNLFTTKAKL
ncbi:hypothetical protein HETIRDRAFT_156110 [Heterobasidion irregulare TC 32-1]|uniref:Choline/carnitine acyltransferase domain-containing protein n=1 Tax=Heterobasidion irregulare (strain TC 32-1) TaxID=747525 RepID=W4K071_HETIT|nr:uncharacterized protein HETIRDRAFT_156110 [Heterobasidion irregulare TC 32-1]ETW79218.1 hypothetical protein HETIRDRAFT_156110 [Heterobasidion irregulare TC 32-1]